MAALLAVGTIGLTIAVAGKLDECDVVAAWQSGADVVGVDWTVDLAQARRRLDDRVALQGNLDPAVLFAPPAAVQAEARAVLDSFGDPRRSDGRFGGHIFNLGHGINQHTPPDHVAALVEEVHAHSRRLRQGA